MLSQAVAPSGRLSLGQSRFGPRQGNIAAKLPVMLLPADRVQRGCHFSFSPRNARGCGSGFWCALASVMSLPSWHRTHSVARQAFLTKAGPIWRPDSGRALNAEGRLLQQINLLKYLSVLPSLVPLEGRDLSWPTNACLLVAISPVAFDKLAHCQTEFVRDICGACGDPTATAASGFAQTFFHDCRQRR